MKVLGIDPGTAITGYGLVTEDESGQIGALEFGVITTPAGMPLEQRLLIIHDELKKLILFHRPDTAAVEKLFFQRNVRTAISVGQARGVVLLALAEADISLGNYTPLEVKQAVTGYGGADKRQVQLMVQVLLGLCEVPQPDDAADALAVAICHLNHARLMYT